MRVLAVNGSPRKRWNTATLLDHVLSGAASVGAETEMIHLYDLSYRGCISCFACKLIGGESYGRCAIQDALTPILERVSSSDVLVLGSPLYLNTETGAMRSLMERLLFPYLTYTPGYESIFPRTIPTALVYTMNVSLEDLPRHPQHTMIAASEKTMKLIFGHCEVFLCTDTYQFDDYSKYVSSVWDADAKARRRSQVFPQDCERASELGVRLVARARFSEGGSEEPKL